MRLVPVLALMTSAFALAACAGGGGGLGGGGTLSAASMVASNGNGVCTVQQTSADCIPVTTPVVTPTLPDSDGDGVPDGTDGTDGDGDNGSGAGGNATGLSAGNRTIALQGFIYDTPVAPDTALSVLTSTTSTTQPAITAAILSATKPTNLKFEIDTKSAKNSQWAVPIQMDEFRSGTRDLSWIKLGHTVGGITTPPVLNGFALGPLTYDPIDKRYETATGVGVNYREDIYWNQLTPYMNAKANGGAMANYREYRAKDLSEAVNRDELLQVWAWDDSYAYQYQNTIGGGIPKQQAWSFGGNATAVMPTAGNATYKGRFVAAAQTTGWIKKEGATIDPNALWRVQGQSTFDVDFASTTGDIRGTLTPETWTSYQADLKGDYTWYTSASGTQSADTVATPNYSYIYETKTTIDASLDAPTGTTKANTFSGTAKLDEPYISYTDHAYGGFFGTTAGEVTGVFNSAGAQVDPLGGSDGINNTKNAFLTINGAFNGKCTNAGGVCPP